jgi:hypothetical protein
MTTVKADGDRSEEVKSGQLGTPTDSEEGGSISEERVSAQAETSEETQTGVSAAQAETTLQSAAIALEQREGHGSPVSRPLLALELIPKDGLATIRNNSSRRVYIYYDETRGGLEASGDLECENELEIAVPGSGTEGETNIAPGGYKWAKPILGMGSFEYRFTDA